MAPIDVRIKFVLSVVLNEQLYFTHLHFFHEIVLLDDIT